MCFGAESPSMWLDWGRMLSLTGGVCIKLLTPSSDFGKTSMGDARKVFRLGGAKPRWGIAHNVTKIRDRSNFALAKPQYRRPITYAQPRRKPVRGVRRRPPPHGWDDTHPDPGPGWKERKRLGGHAADDELRAPSPRCVS